MTGRRPDGRVRRSAGLLTAAALVGGALTGCATPESCVSWVSFDDEDARIADSDLVVDVDALERDGTQSMYGAEANVWTGEVTEVVSAQGGSIAAEGDEIRIVSTPETCTEGSPYPSGDPLDTDGVVRVYLHEGEAGDGSWSLVTPFQGVGPLEG